MFEKLKSLFIKYRELISYVFFGGLTTLVSWGSYFVLNEVFHAHYLISQTLSWILAVLFAFVTNKKYVFEDKTSSKNNIIVQLAQFTASRLFSFAVETVLLIITVDVMKMNENIAKIAVSVITVVLNYFTSKFIVFKKTDTDKNPKSGKN